jgi:hypothetical protein
MKWISEANPIISNKVLRKHYKFYFSLALMLPFLLSDCSKSDPAPVSNGPKAGFTYSIGWNGTVQFVSSPTLATTITWSFGEGGTSADNNPVHTFPNGTFTVKQTVTVVNVGAVSSSQNIVVTNAIDLGGKWNQVSTSQVGCTDPVLNSPETSCSGNCASVVLTYKTLTLYKAGVATMTSDFVLRQVFPDVAIFQLASNSEFKTKPDFDYYFQLSNNWTKLRFITLPRFCTYAGENKGFFDCNGIRPCTDFSGSYLSPIASVNCVPTNTTGCATQDTFVRI